MTTENNLDTSLYLNGRDNRREYFQLLERFATLLGLYGQDILPWQSRQSLYFSQLPDSRQVSVLRHFRTYVAVCESVHSNSGNVTNNKVLLWRMLVAMKLRPESDLLDTIDDDDFIEIYNKDYVQVFRNIKFFSVCSYTLDDLLCRPWWELFYRDETVTKSIFKIADSVFSGEIQGTALYNIPSHFVDELNSPRLYRSVVENKFVSPLYDDCNKLVAVVNVVRGISCYSRKRATKKTHESIINKEL